MKYIVGIDLGQSQDHSALAILEAHGKPPERRYDVRHLEQFALNTLYPRIVEHTTDLLARPPLPGQCQLVLDMTGVGRPIYDLFDEAKLRPVGIVITGGIGWHRETARVWHVAKILLVSTVQKFLQSGRLKVANGLTHAATLQEELRSFRVKISKSANETYDSREGAHDDMLLSVAVAIFAAEHPMQRWAPIGDDGSLWFRQNPFTTNPTHNVAVDDIGWGWRRL